MDKKDAEFVGLVILMTLALLVVWVFGWFDDFMGAIIAAIFLAALTLMLKDSRQKNIQGSKVSYIKTEVDGTWMIERITNNNMQTIVRGLDSQQAEVVVSMLKKERKQ